MVSTPEKNTDTSKNKINNDFRDTISTVDETTGKRIWVYPKKQKGYYYKRRTYLSYILLTLLFGLPFVKVGGEPLLLFNILERKFIIFGMIFTAQDFYIFAVLMITGVVFVSLFTVIWGRLFCGWVCPQTIFMEMVFRKIEYWIEGDANEQKRLNRKPWNREKLIKKVSKQIIFFSISLLIAHTFLSYIIGWESVFELVTQSPSKDWTGFLSMVTFTFVFYGVFAYMREQVCIAVCPYGRLQGVLNGESTVNVIYDWVRGEPRGRLKRRKSQEEQSAQGDCIDCNLCVQVCPTGIDIRNGTQMECINCTACIDACNSVMEKINRDLGLIRYDSHEGVKGKNRKKARPRVLAYSGVLLALLALDVVLLASRADINATIVRTPGLLYQYNDDGSLNNLYKYQLSNKVDEDMPIEFRLSEGVEGTIRVVGKQPIATPGEVTEGVLFIDQPQDQGPKKLTVELWSGDRQVDQVRVTFVRPR
ncbi:MAG: cytochrome c oxidase accessory protein CcoG [Bacteroidota bacterium]